MEIGNPRLHLSRSRRKLSLLSVERTKGTGELFLAWANRMQIGPDGGGRE